MPKAFADAAIFLTRKSEKATVVVTVQCAALVFGLRTRSGSGSPALTKWKASKQYISSTSKYASNNVLLCLAFDSTLDVSSAAFYADISKLPFVHLLRLELMQDHCECGTCWHLNLLCIYFLRIGRKFTLA